MQEYVSLRQGHMDFLIGALDGTVGTVTTTRLPTLPETASAGLVQEAVAFLKRTSLIVDPRKQWPTGGLPHYGVKGRIPFDLQAEPGRALSMWGDAGWGAEVKNGKYRDHRFNDDLVRACADMVRAWNPQPAPTWITCIPSHRHPNLVRGFADRLANALRLPFQAVLEKTDDRPEQKAMANSTQQARNVDGSLRVCVGQLPQRSVLLVDDLIDSGWTMTISAWLLRTHGSGRVFPVSLSLAGKGQ
jgi:ATP-dependent DNA helicase RecQ